MDGFMASCLLLVVIASLTPTSLAVQCYVCSWSPRDENNRTDWCTMENFGPNVAYIDDKCEHGCETFLQWDKNDVLEHFRRNCIQKETKLTGDCVQDEDRARRWHHCTCDSDLCNSAIYRAGTPLLTAVISILVVAGFVL